MKKTIAIILLLSCLAALISAEEYTEADLVAQYNAAMASWNKGDYQTALKHYTKAAEIAEIIFGKEHETTAIYYNNLGMGLLEAGTIQQGHRVFGKVPGYKTQNPGPGALPCGHYLQQPGIGL